MIKLYYDDGPVEAVEKLSGDLAGFGLKLETREGEGEWIEAEVSADVDLLKLSNPDQYGTAGEMYNALKRIHELLKK